MTEEYYTVAGKAEGELVEKRSKFIATVLPVHSQEEAMAYIDALRSKYWDARHNVYAYTLLDGQIKRYSDDGEPSGTAGVPVLNVIEKLELKDTLVVVTRYFGGILLGTGGLVRAYSQSAKIGIENAGVVKRCLCDILDIKVDYTLLGKVQKFFEQREIKIKDVLYSDTVTVSVLLTVSDTDSVIASVTELCDGKAEFEKSGQDYADF